MPFALQGQTGLFPTMPSVVAAMCANEQGEFASYHEGLFELQGTQLFNSEAGFMQVATAMNMDTDAFGSCPNDNAYAETGIENITMSQQASVNSTPSFFIDANLLPGNQPISIFRQRLDSLLGS